MQTTPATGFVRPKKRRAYCAMLALSIGMVSIGCGKSNQPILPSGVETGSSASEQAGPVVVHPEYANWSRFPVGSQVTRYRVVSNQTGKVEVTTVLKLTEKTDEYVEVVSQVNVQRSGEELQENPPETNRFASSFKLPKGLTEEFFQLPSSKAKKVGQEPQSVGDKTVQADVFEWTESNETGPMSVKLWRSDDIPGRIIRQEMLIESSQTKTVEELREVK